MAKYQLQTGSVLSYEATEVLAPDIVTEQLANRAVELLGELHTEPPYRVLDIGVGSGVFLRSVGDSCDFPVELVGVDISHTAIRVARANLPFDESSGKTVRLLQADWRETTLTPDTFDCIYFNPPYLEPGTPLRAEFKGSPEVAVYNNDIETTYTEATAAMLGLLKVGGVAFIRFPGDGTLVEPDFRTLESSFMGWIGRVIGENAVFLWRSVEGDRNISAGIIAKVEGDISNAPQFIRDMHEWYDSFH